MIKRFFNKVVAPVSLDQDSRRSEFILNVLLLSSIGLSLFTFLINAFLKLIDGGRSLPLGTFIFILAFFLGLYALSRKGFFKISAYAILVLFFLLSTYQIYVWGSDLPSALLSYVLIIVMAGILISTRFTFITTLFISATVGTISYLQIYKVIPLNAYWKENPIIPEDFIVFIVIFFIIATVSWLSNREIEKSLERALKSEAELKTERDSLEIKVEEKTKELKESQAEKLAQLYRFAEFGRLSSSLFHDLMNPLSAVSLNMEKVNTDDGSISQTKEHLQKALLATKKMEDLVKTVRKQLSREENKTLFSVNDEISQVKQVLEHKAQSSKVEIEIIPFEEVYLYGDATKFHYSMLNLLANAVDAYKGTANRESIKISAKKEGPFIWLEIKDNGSGIKEEHLEKIFEPFFTTKPDSEGTGVGLSMTKRMIEKDFSGTISVKSTEGKGTIFTVKIPLKTAP